MANFIIESAHNFNASEVKKKTKPKTENRKPKSKRLSLRMQFLNSFSGTMVVDSTGRRRRQQQQKLLKFFCVFGKWNFSKFQSCCLFMLRQQRSVTHLVSNSSWTSKWMCCEISWNWLVCQVERILSIFRVRVHIKRESMRKRLSIYMHAKYLCIFIKHKPNRHNDIASDAIWIMH